MLFTCRYTHAWPRSTLFNTQKHIFGIRAHGTQGRLYTHTHPFAYSTGRSYVDMLAENTAPMPFGKQQQRNQHAKSAYYSSTGAYTPQPVPVAVASTSRQTVTTFGVDDRVTTQQPTISRMSNKNVYNGRAYEDNVYDGRRKVYSAAPELTTFFKHVIADNNASATPTHTDSQATVVTKPREGRSVDKNAPTSCHTNTIQIRDGEQANIQMQTVRRDRLVELDVWGLGLGQPKPTSWL